MTALLLLAACAGDGRTIEARPGDDSAPSDHTPADDSGSGDTDSPVDTDTGPLVLDYPDQRVGIFYLAWHAYAADAQARLDAASQRTVEDIIRGAPSLQFSDMLWDAGLYDEAMAFHWHQRPQLGFYCLYRPRDGESAPAEPNGAATCPNISAVAASHATTLWDAEIDFVYVDLTNVPGYSDFTDVLGVRPLEVLFEEWGALRRAGVPTPQIAAWVPAVAYTDGTVPTLRKVLDAYDAADPDLVLVDERTGQRVVFIVSHLADESVMDEARARGVLPVKMWGNLDDASLAAGVAAWMQPCHSGDQFTTLVEPGVPCGQHYTTTSPLGTVVSVSRSFQVGYASLPLQASGRMGGLTFQKQMETAFAVRPDWLLVNAWNEHVAQPQANPYDPSLGGLRRSMGVTDVPDGDATADWLWVDMYGAELNRDFEPTVEDGGAGLELLRSCLRVYRTGATSCSDPAEECCQLGEGWSLIRSFRAGGTGSDHVPTREQAEIDTLRAGGWTEVCNPHYGPPGLCGGGTTGDGPFFLHPSAGADRQAVYRCFSGADHFMSNDPACEGRTTESTLGWASTVRTSATPRPLRRCYDRAATAHLHWLDEHCPEGTEEEGVLGYVR